MKICVFGSLNIDQTYYVDHINLPKETASCNSLKISCGGKGMNQAIAIRKANFPVYMAGCIGTNADLLLESLKDNDVNIQFLKKVNCPNGHAIIQVDNNGQNSILVYPGSNEQITDSQIEETINSLDKGDLLVLQNEISKLDKIIELAYQKNIKIAFNPSPIKENLKDLPLNKVDFFFINEVEGKALCGNDDPQKILTSMKKLYPHATIVLTLGENGSVASYGNEQFEQKAFTVDHVVDTVGAGDTFMGYYLATYAKGSSISDCLKTATAASALSIQKEGASSSVPSYDEVIHFLKLK